MATEVLARVTRTRRWRKSETICTMEFRKPHETIVTTQEGMMLIVVRSAEPERFARQKLRGKVIGIMAAPFGACPEKYFEKEICIFDDTDGFFWICVMEEENEGEPQ